MRKIMFVGRSESGKTTLTQAMKGKKIIYHKTQYVNHYDVIIDTPGEYAETSGLAVHWCLRRGIGRDRSPHQCYGTVFPLSAELHFPEQPGSRGYRDQM